MWISVVFDEVFFRDHLDICVVSIDGDGSAKCNCDRTIPSKERPPDSFPESLVGSAELGGFDTGID